MRKLAAALLFGHLVLMLYLTLVAYTTAPLLPDHRINLVPFRTISWYLHVGGHELMVNIVGNLGIFVPVGFLWPILRGGRTTLVRTALVSAELSLTIEVLQFFRGFRISDVDDVLLNALGGVMGYVAYVGCRETLRVGARIVGLGRKETVEALEPYAGPHGARSADEPAEPNGARGSDSAA